MKIRKPYTQHRTQTINTLPSRTKQSDTEATDINYIMQKYQRGEAITHFNTHQAQYGEVSGNDFETAMNIVTDAQNMFLELPSNIRNRFSNDPRQFIDFVTNESNSSEMAELGLINTSPETTDFQSDVQGETDASASDPVEPT